MRKLLERLIRNPCEHTWIEYTIPVLHETEFIMSVIGHTTHEVCSDCNVKKEINEQRT